MAKNNWKTLNSDYVHENKWYKVRKDDVIMPNGKPGVYNVIETHGSVYILPIIDNKIILINLFRYPTQADSWEIPAGHIEAGEDPLESAKRELQEETGFEATTWVKLGIFQIANGISNSIGHIFIAKDLETTTKNEQEEEGISSAKLADMHQLKLMIESGKISDGPTLAVFMQAVAHGYINL